MDLRPFSLVLLLSCCAVSPMAGADNRQPDPRLDPEARARGFVGSAECGSCHPKELALWQGSHHDLAMAPANESSVLGDFDDAVVSAQGVESRFFRRDGGYYVRTDGPDGTPDDFPIRFTFGWYPLQQYLIEGPGGRLQALGLAWDSRPAVQGGQRWFHLYPSQRVDHTDPLHWTGREQTWNYQCADCHSTDLRKGYDQELDAYATRYAEIDVACEACHGPGARHAEWARARAASQTGTDGAARPAGAPDPAVSEAKDPAGSLPVDLRDRDGGEWRIDPQTGKPFRSVPRASQAQIQVCARCHSRRGRIWGDIAPDEPLHQGFRLALLEPELYFPDGQIRDEVYVYGSFLQSRMHAKGVVCSDCHEPHGLKLRAEGNGVCARCHSADRYDVPAHHRHPQGSPGAACVACHMPQRFYMVVDERADHSLRVPRPDLSVRLGTPNACNGCHKDQDAAWAAAAVADWFPDPVNRGPHYGEALHAADTGAPDAPERLLALAGDPGQPPIARASALDRLHERPSPEALPTIGRLTADPDALVRAQAVRFLDVADLRTRVQLAWPLLDDPARTVRLEAARVLAPVLTQGIGGKLAERLGVALEEYVASETQNADRPEAHLNLGLLASSAGEPQVAEQAYRSALRLDPAFVPAYANLADLFREQGREGEAVAELMAGLAVAPENAALYHALGLAQVRAGESDAALEALARALELAPESARYGYVYAIALDSAGRTAEAVPVLRNAQSREPASVEVLVALVRLNAKLGHREDARGWLEKLAAIRPGDPELEGLRGLVEGGSEPPVQK